MFTCVNRLKYSILLVLFNGIMPAQGIRQPKMKNYRCLGPIGNLKVAGTTNAGVLNCFYIFAPAQGPVAQWIEQQPSKLRAIGSNPIGVTTKTQPVNQQITGFVIFSKSGF